MSLTAPLEDRNDRLDEAVELLVQHGRRQRLSRFGALAAASTGGRPASTPPNQTAVNASPRATAEHENEALAHRAKQLVDQLTSTPPQPEPTEGKPKARGKTKRKKKAIEVSKAAGAGRESRLRNHYPTGQQLSDDPVVYLFEDFIEEIEIEALLAASRSHLQQSLVTGNKKSEKSDWRTGGLAWIHHRHTPAIGRLADRLSDLVGLPLWRAEDFQVIHYGQNQEYAPHLDGWVPDSERGQRCMERGGQRLVTCLFYLNDVADGGGTCFPRLDLEVVARRGRMLVFHNCEPGSNELHRDSRHGGLPVESGEKWAANLWFRERRFTRARPRSGQFGRVV